MLKKMFGTSESNVNTIIVIGVLAGIGPAFLFGMWLFSWTATGAIPVGRIFALLFMIACASFFVGTLVGVLFGIPKVLSSPQQGQAGTRTDSKDTSQFLASKVTQEKYQVNTNLEQVSDWLTKILVGVGLTQFHKVKDILVGVSSYFSADFGMVEGIQPMITSIIVIYSIYGFLTGYLITRLFLSRALIEADIEGKKRDEMSSTENLQQQLENEPLSVQEQHIFEQIIASYEHGEAYILPVETANDSEQYKNVLRLKERQLIQFKEVGSSELGQEIELTLLAQQHIRAIKEKIAKNTA